MEQAGLLGTDNFLGDLTKHMDTVKIPTLNTTRQSWDCSILIEIGNQHRAGKHELPGITWVQHQLKAKGQLFNKNLMVFYGGAMKI